MPGIRMGSTSLGPSRSGRRPVEQLVEGDPVRSLSGVASTERESHDSTLRWTPPPLDELDGTGHVPTIRQR
jgi:hypothetical protein